MTLSRNMGKASGYTEAEQKRQAAAEQGQMAQQYAGGIIMGQAKWNAAAGSNTPGSKPTPAQLRKRAAENLLLREKEHTEYQASMHARIEAQTLVFEPLLRDLGTGIAAWNAHQGFWESDNVGEKIALMHSELSEMLEADRKDAPSDKIPMSGVEEEAADVLIRLLDFCGHFRLDLGRALRLKLLMNLGREYRHGKGY